jgi:hypothetical protein
MGFCIEALVDWRDWPSVISLTVTSDGRDNSLVAPSAASKILSPTPLLSTSWLEVLIACRKVSTSKIGTSRTFIGVPCSGRTDNQMKNPVSAIRVKADTNGKRAGRKISLNSSVYRSRGTGRNIKIGNWRHKR